MDGKISFYSMAVVLYQGSARADLSSIPRANAKALDVAAYE